MFLIHTFHCAAPLRSAELNFGTSSRFLTHGTSPGPLCGEILSGLQALGSHGPNPRYFSRSAYRAQPVDFEARLEAGDGNEPLCAPPQSHNAPRHGPRAQRCALSFPHSNEPPRAAPRGTSGFVVPHSQLNAGRRLQPDSFSRRASGRGRAVWGGAGNAGEKG